MELDDIDRRIVAALQVDGRAPWRRIASVIDVPFSTVSRRGNALLEAGAVRIAPMERSERTVVLSVVPELTKVDEVARALAARSTSVFVYAVSAPTRILVEEHLDPATVADVVLREIPAIEGVREVSASPVLEYYRTIAQWSPGLLTPAEIEELNPRFGQRRPQGPPLSEQDTAIVDVLKRDGRAPIADVAEAIGLSEPAARRRLASLLAERAEVRAVVAPSLLGLPVSAFAWLRVRPSAIDRVAERLLESPWVRYCVMTLGEHQLVIDVAAPSLVELRGFLTESEWTLEVESMTSSMVLAGYKRGRVAVAEW